MHEEFINSSCRVKIDILCTLFKGFSRQFLHNELSQSRDYRALKMQTSTDTANKSLSSNFKGPMSSDKLSKQG